MTNQKAPFTVHAEITPYGSLVKRFFAFFIDSLVANNLAAWLMYLLNLTGSSWEWLLGIIIYLGYFFLMTWKNNGQTLGKMIFKLRVVNENFETLNLREVVLREIIGRFIQSRLVFLYLIVFFTERKASVADFIAGTCVIKDVDYLEE